MSTKVVMEALSPTMEEGRLVEWKKQEGEPVAVGDVLAEVETDKAVMELVARAGGTLLKQVIPAGTTVPVSELVAVIGEPGEEVGDGGKAGSDRPPKTATTEERQGTQPAPDRNRPSSMPPAPPAEALTEGRFGVVGPVVRRLLWIRIASGRKGLQRQLAKEPCNAAQAWFVVQPPDSGPHGVCAGFGHDVRLGSAGGCSSGSQR